MAKNPNKSQAPLSRKHLDRLHREQRQTRYITIGSILVILAVILVILYGYLDQRYFRFMRSVAVVNGEKISANEFRDFTKYYRNNLIQNAENLYQLASMFGSDQNALESFGSQLVQISDELDAERAGNQALNQLIEDKLVRQEAQKRGISVSSDEVEVAMQEALRYYANGTPTPSPTAKIKPTSTLSSEQIAMLPPSATPSPTADAAVTATATLTATVIAPISPTPQPTVQPTSVVTVTATPLPTATPYTLEGYQVAYGTMVANLAAVEVKEEILRYVIESRLIQDKMIKEIVGEVACVEDQVRAQHILVADEILAKDIHQRAVDGEDWFKLAAEYSTDASNKDQGGDLGWFGKGAMVAEFEQAAYNLTKPGQISEPVQSQFGWHIIRLVARQEMPLTASECSRLPDEKFQEWVAETRANSNVELNDRWQELVPLLPTLPVDLQQVISSLRTASSQPPVELPTPAP